MESQPMGMGLKLIGMGWGWGNFCGNGLGMRLMSTTVSLFSLYSIGGGLHLPTWTPCNVLNVIFNQIRRSLSSYQKPVVG